MITLEALGHLWQVFFHEPAPVATLCVFRIALGSLLTFNAACLLPFASDLFGPRGLFESTLFLQTYRVRRLSLFYLAPQAHFLAPAVVVTFLVASVAVTIGLFTWFATPLAWLCLVSLHHRNPAVFNAGDTVQRLLLLLLCFAPGGAALSVDAWLRGQDIWLSTREQLFDPWALRLMQLQVSIIYLQTVAWKLRGNTWRNGTAIAYALCLTDFKRCAAPSVLLHPAMIRLGTYGTLAAETFVGGGVWISQLRYPAIVVGIFLHLGIDTFLNVHLFGLTMCVALLTFLPPTDVASWLNP